jgi:hypothetical protein
MMGGGMLRSAYVKIGNGKRVVVARGLLVDGAAQLALDDGGGVGHPDRRGGGSRGMGGSPGLSNPYVFPRQASRGVMRCDAIGGVMLPPPRRNHSTRASAARSSRIPFLFLPSPGPSVHDRRPAKAELATPASEAKKINRVNCQRSRVHSSSWSREPAARFCAPALHQPGPRVCQGTSPSPVPLGRETDMIPPCRLHSTRLGAR